MIPRNTPQTVQDVPILQWASGRTEARPITGGRFQGFVGFHAERGKDADLDAACEAAAIPLMELRHPRPSGQPAIVTHHAFGESLRVYPITAGPVATTISGSLRLSDATAAAGIGLAWPAGDKSRMALRCLILLGDTPILVQLSVRSTMTGYLLAALVDHYRACAVADELIDRAMHPDPVLFHELALPLTAGDETTVGKGETALITPLVSAHPSDLDRAYVVSCWRSKVINAAAVAAWPGIVVWAAGYAGGETNGDSHLDGAPLEEAPPARREYAPGVKPTMRKLPTVDIPL